MREHSMQAKVVQYVRTFYPDVVLAAIPNGSGTTPRNRLYLYTEGLLAGMPDLFLAKPSKGFYGLFIEMKTDTGEESKEQKELRKRLNQAGYLVFVARSDRTAINLIEDYLTEE